MNKNPNFKYENDNFLQKIDHLDDKYLSLIAKSSSYISPGDILRFTYMGELVNVLVVKTKIWSPAGLFLSSQFNPLISCYKLDNVGDDLNTEASSAILKKILKAIYNNRGIAFYKKVLTPLGNVIGEENFKTYNLQKTGTIVKLSLDKKRLNLTQTQDVELTKIKKEISSISKRRKALIKGLLDLEQYIGDSGAA